MTDVTVLNVGLHGKNIGTLTRAGDGRVIFAFTSEYIEDPDRYTLSQSLYDEFGLLRETPVDRKLPSFFSNLLPEGKLREYLARKAGIDERNEFSLLWALGDDLPGAVTITPADDEPWPPVTLSDISQAEVSRSGLRYSLAGVQMKFSAFSGKSSNLTIPARGTGGNWIVKLASREYAGLPENEYSMMTLAKLLGMDVPENDLCDVSEIEGLPDDVRQFGVKAFIIERFDRGPGQSRIHIEDFAQTLNVPPEDKYSERFRMSGLARLAATVGTDEDIIEFIRRLVFNTLIGNGDMHLKNWSLVYPDGRNARLAPAYDFVSTLEYMAPRTFAHFYSRRRRNFSDLDEDELSNLASKAALPRGLVLDVARQTRADFFRMWEKEKHHLPMFSHVRNAIDDLWIG